MKSDIAAKFAEELWDKYMKTTDPSKRRVYGLRYEFWANVRDSQCVCLGNPHIECSAEHTVK